MTPNPLARSVRPCPPGLARRAARARAGFALLEVSLAIALLTIGMGFFTQSFILISGMYPLAEDEALAMERARNVAETIRATAFNQLVVSYNGLPGDDPGGAGTAPGDTFGIEDSSRRLEHPDGPAGQVLMPLVGAMLREDLVDAALGMPRDLNGDGVIDGLDHAGEYHVLPVVVRTRWMNKQGEQTFELHLTLTNMTVP